MCTPFLLSAVHLRNRILNRSRNFKEERYPAKRDPFFDKGSILRGERKTFPIPLPRIKYHLISRTFATLDTGDICVLLRPEGNQRDYARKCPSTYVLMYAFSTHYCRLDPFQHVTCYWVEELRPDDQPRIYDGMDISIYFSSHTLYSWIFQTQWSGELQQGNWIIHQFVGVWGSMLRQLIAIWFPSRLGLEKHICHSIYILHMLSRKSINASLLIPWEKWGYASYMSMKGMSAKSNVKSVFWSVRCVLKYNIINQCCLLRLILRCFARFPRILLLNLFPDGKCPL